MEEITSNDNATQVVATLNSNFGSGIQELSVNNNAADFIEKVNDNFELVAQQGGGGAIGTEVFRFLHFSDPHFKNTSNKTGMIDKCEELLASGQYDGVMLTGDIIVENNSTAYTKLAGLAASGKLYALAGNHDTGDGYPSGTAQSQSGMTSYLRDIVTDDNVNWGDFGTGGAEKASFYYRDFVVSPLVTVRYIAIDQYEYDVVGKPSQYDYMVVYSQKQIEWLIDLLANTPSGYYVIMAAHEHPFIHDAAFVAEAKPTSPYTDNTKLFVTENLAADDFGSSSTNKWRRKAVQHSLIPLIVNAWKNKGRYQATFDNFGYGNSFTVDADFREMSSQGTFLFHLCGHTHKDMMWYLKNAYNDRSGTTFTPVANVDLGDQLAVCITMADSAVNWGDQDDLIKDYNDSSSTVNGIPAHCGVPVDDDEPSYRINDVLIDFSSRTINITRIGTHTTAGGRNRRYISFPFVKPSNNS